MASFIKLILTRIEPLEKNGFLTIRKREPYTTIYYISQKVILTNLRVLILNIIIVFSNPSLKMPKQGIFGPNFKVFLF